MKRNKIVSVIGMLVVLLSMAAMVSCGGNAKTVTGVWEQTAPVDSLLAPNYYYFDGKDKVYVASSADGKDFSKVPRLSGDYSAKGGKISMPLTENVKCSFEVKGDILAIYQRVAGNALFGISTRYEFKKSNVDANKIKNAK
ncbi:hypothetical protein [Treponema pedis]|uniref:hypothetical protein n=1 Tax=Treponema pedis TaxID=409322 RepID=UPI00197D04A0|nr:hypothetical protein [Treponema pedis]QSI04284.1 hypothetical protein DYQ05_04715 [Treponema pedis]